jgi:membrane protein DedA with SNARE-associated domain
MSQTMVGFLVGYTLMNQGKFSYLNGLGFTISCWLSTIEIQGVVCSIFENNVTI